MNGSRKHNNAKVLSFNTTFGRGEAESSPERDSSEAFRTGFGGLKTNPKSGHLLKNVLFSECKDAIRGPNL